MRTTFELYNHQTAMLMLNTFYTLALSCWLGGATLFTFVLTPKLFAALSRDMAGMIIGLLFPGYFRWGLACGTVALLCKLAGRGRFSLLCIALLATMLVLTATQALVIEPRAAAIKAQMREQLAGARTQARYRR